MNVGNKGTEKGRRELLAKKGNEGTGHQQRKKKELRFKDTWKEILKKQKKTGERSLGITSQLVADHILKLKEHSRSPKCKALNQPDVKHILHKLHANCVLVPAYKATNNVIVVCHKYYTAILLLGCQTSIQTKFVDC